MGKEKIAQESKEAQSQNEKKMPKKNTKKKKDPLVGWETPTTGTVVLKEKNDSYRGEEGGWNL